MKQGARILDTQGELIGTASTVGLVDPTDARDDAHAEASGDAAEETEKAVADVYAALDRLGARTHVYARTIVPPASSSDDISAFASSSGTNRHAETVLGGVAQSSMRTVPHAHVQQQQQHLHHSTSGQRTPHAFPTTNLPPFPGRVEQHPGQQQQQQQQVEEPTSQIDPSLEEHAGHAGHAEDEELMMVDAETGLSLPE